MMSCWCILWSVVAKHFVPLETRTKASNTAAVLQKLTNNHLLVKIYLWCHHTAIRAAWPHNGAHELLHDFHGGIFPEQGDGVLHDRGITGQCVPPTFAAHKAKLLLRHPQELAEDHRAEVHKRHLKPCPIGSVHHEVALHRHR